MKKKWILLLAIVNLMVLVSCSDNDGTDDFNYVYISKGEWPHVESDACMIDVDNVRVRLSLMDANGKPQTEFKKGENIVFQVSIENLSSDSIGLYDDNERNPGLFSELFNIYKASDISSSSGKAITPYVGFKTQLYAVLILAPGSKRIWRCPWWASPDIPGDYDQFHFTIRKDQKALAKGDYVARVVVNLAKWIKPDDPFSHGPRLYEPDDLHTLEYKFKVK